MPRRLFASFCALAVLASGCILPKDQRPTVTLGTTLATKFVHRGQTLVNQPVLQPTLQVESPTIDGGGMRITAEANMELRNNTGAAWFPDGHAGRFTQIDSRSLINADITYHAAGDRWSLGAYGKNVTDERYDNGRLNTGDYILVILSNDASEFGLHFTTRF